MFQSLILFSFLYSLFSFLFSRPQFYILISQLQFFYFSDHFNYHRINIS